MRFLRSIRERQIVVAPTVPALMNVCRLACQPESLGASVWSAYAACDRVPAPADSLREKGERRLVSRVFAGWNQLDGWLRQVEGLRRVA